MELVLESLRCFLRLLCLRFLAMSKAPLEEKFLSVESDGSSRNSSMLSWTVKLSLSRLLFASLQHLKWALSSQSMHLLNLSTAVLLEYLLPDSSYYYLVTF